MDSPTQSTSTSTPPFDPYTLVPHPEDVWVRTKSRKYCTESEFDAGVNWVDVDSANRATSRGFTSQGGLREYVRNEDRECRLRVISLVQDHSWKPLKITIDMLSALLDITKASPEFLNIVSCFHKRNNAVEEGFCAAPVFRSNPGSIEIEYAFKYTSYKEDTDGKDPWPIRQTGVYQRYDLETGVSAAIFMHPTKESAFQSRLENCLNCLESAEHCAMIRKYPLLLHGLFMSMYLPPLRDFMAYY